MNAPADRLMTQPEVLAWARSVVDPLTVQQEGTLFAVLYGSLHARLGSEVTISLVECLRATAEGFDAENATPGEAD